MFTIGRRRSSRKTRQTIDIHQNKFDKGYISTLSNSRRPRNSLSDLMNMEIVQDGIPRPRASTVAYGTQPTLTVVGRGTYRYNGERYEVFMMNDGGAGKVYKRKDGGAFTEIVGDGYTTNFSVTAWSCFTQSRGRVYIYNGVDYLQFIDLAAGKVKQYTELSAPAAPTLTRTNSVGTVYTYYYKVAANNSVGTTAASTATSQQTLNLREDWATLSSPATVKVAWSAVAGATSYNVYVGTTQGSEKLVFVTTALEWTDDGAQTPDPFTIAPTSNSTKGMIPTWIYNDARNSQVFALDASNILYYSSLTSGLDGDFSYNDGGGYHPIEQNGDITLNFVDGFRDGKGNPVLTVSGRGAAGRGKMFHSTIESATYGDSSWSYVNVYEANGQSATYAPRATVKSRDSLLYPTGRDINTTGTSQNIVNILTNQSIASAIQPDMETINLDALDGAVGLEYQDKVLLALPIGTDHNNQIWYCDRARGDIWVLRWTFYGEIKDLWTYEDNSGVTHSCILVDNDILEFTRNLFTQDNGTAFNTRCAFSSLVWDEDGLVMANIRKMYFKFLNPRGSLSIKINGLNKEGQTNMIGSDTFDQSASLVAWDKHLYDAHTYDEDPGTISSYAKSIGSQKIKTNAKMVNQLDWEVTTSTIGCDYLLSAVNTMGTTNSARKLGD